MESSGDHSFGINAFSIKGTSVQNPKNKVMQIANAPVIRI